MIFLTGMGIGDWFSQFVVTFFGWFWPIVGSIGIGLAAALIVNHDKWSPLTLLGGLLLALLFYGQGAYFQISGYNMVNDLKVQFEAATAATDESGRSPLNINQDALVKLRNERLGRYGICTYGAWWQTKSSGEKPVAHTNWINYYYCGRYY